jgi:hypothetical protein
MTTIQWDLDALTRYTLRQTIMRLLAATQEPVQHLKQSTSDNKYQY